MYRRRVWQAETLFGTLGTSARCAGGTLLLEDTFFSDRNGRKITVLAPSRQIASICMKSVFFHLCRAKASATPSCEWATSEWKYADSKGQMHGPYPTSQILAWARRGAFGSDTIPIQHSTKRCWVPLWFILSIHEDGSADLKDAMDWELAVADVQVLRSQGILSGLHEVGHKMALIEEFPELTSAPEAMDYDASIMTADMHAVMGDGPAHVVVVVDTNVLISHLASTVRIFEHLTEEENASVVEVFVLVPWIVLNELDRLKDDHDSTRSSGGSVSEAARRALKTLRRLTSDRDSWIRGQTATEFSRIAESIRLPDIDMKRLQNDDAILQTCLGVESGLIQQLRTAGQRSSVFLLTNDRGLMLRAEVLGIKSFSSAELPRTPQELASHVPIQASMDVAEPSGGKKEGMLAEDPGEEATNALLVTLRSLGMQPTDILAELDSLQHGAQPGGKIVKVLDALSLHQAPPVVESHVDAAPTSEQPRLSNKPELGCQIEDIIVCSLGPMVKYHRQQDLGELWLEMLDDDLQPPWSGKDIMEILSSHSSTFWDVVSKNAINTAHQLSKSLRSRLWYSQSSETVRGTAREVLGILLEFERSADVSRLDSLAPNPAEVPDYVSLGEAKRALHEGIQRLYGIIQRSQQ